MTCFYCDLIASSDDRYPVKPAAYDLGSPAPRCALHWRYVCGECYRAAHFMSVAYCPTRQAFYCSSCAPETRVAAASFFAWDYHFRYRSPWTGAWNPSLDRLEFEGRHPLLVARHGRPDASLSKERFLWRYPDARVQRRLETPPGEQDVGALWGANADRWDRAFDAAGDEHRRYCSDPCLRRLLGDVASREILDVGCGNGYLCRALARDGAHVTGIDPSKEMIDRALLHDPESRDAPGITYVEGSATDLSAFADESFDAIVFNHVLTSVGDLETALEEAHRVLRGDGHVVAVISHPAFSCGPRGWVAAAPDSPRPDEVASFRVDDYFAAACYLLEEWPGFSPVPYFHRPLRDYWRSFRDAGFAVDAFDEPTPSARGRQALPAWKMRLADRIPSSCVFRLLKRPDDAPRCVGAGPSPSDLPRGHPRR